MFTFFKNLLFPTNPNVIINNSKNSAFFNQVVINECSQRTIDIKKQFKKIKDEISDCVDKKLQDDIENVNKKNNICPKCQHDKSISKFIKQEAEGYISGSSWKALSFGESSISGSFKADTKPVNRCTKCDHEWLIEELKFNRFNTIDFSVASKINKLFNFIKHKNLISTCTFNPNDITEEYNSLDEKKKDLIEDLERDIFFCKMLWEGIYIETIIEISKESYEYKLNDNVSSLLHQHRGVFENEVGIIY